MPVVPFRRPYAAANGSVMGLHPHRTIVVEIIDQLGNRMYRSDSPDATEREYVEVMDMALICNKLGHEFTSTSLGYLDTARREGPDSPRLAEYMWGEYRYVRREDDGNTIHYTIESLD